MRVLLTCVGLQDPYNKEGEEGPILSFCGLLKEIDAHRRKYTPIQAIYLLPTKKREDTLSSTEENAWRTKRILESKGWEDIYVEPLDVSDVFDYWELIPAMREVVGRVRQGGGGECEYLIYVSPGTSQMETTWIILYVANLLPEKTIFLQKREARYGQKGELVREINAPSLIPPEVMNKIMRVTPKKEKDVYCDALSGHIWVDGTDVTSDLNPKGKRLIRLLYRNRWRICTRGMIRSELWPEAPPDTVSEDMIYNQVSRVRRKIEPDPETPQYIITKRGEGYTLRQPDEAG